MFLQMLSGGLRTKFVRLSSRTRVIAVASFILVAGLAPSLVATTAQARELHEDSISDPAVIASPAPARLDPTSRGGLRNVQIPAAPAATPRVRTALPDISTPDRFIAAVVPPAQDSQKETGVPASVTIAQAILESEWGRSGLSKKAQNYFGIKALDGPGPAGTISMDTWEVFGGKNTVIEDSFKAYNNIYESVMDHGDFLRENPRYAEAFKTSDPKQFAQRIHKAGYATDPAYCTKLGSLIDRYNLARYDVKPEEKR